jgi:spartin
MADNSEILYIIPQVSAFHIQDGVESDLNTSGPQSLELSRLEEQDGSGEWDSFLQIKLPPELVLRIPATTRVFHQPPRSYLIAPQKRDADGGAFIRLEFPPLGRGIQQDDVDTFESILAAYTSFMERARPKPGSTKGAPPTYNPAEYKPGEAYAYGTGSGDADQHGQVVLIDHDNGSVVGELAHDETPVDDSAVKPGEKGTLLNI